MLANLKIKHRLSLLTLGVLILLFLLSAYSLMMLKDNIMDARREKTRQVVEMAYSLAEHYGKLADKGVMSQADAKEAAMSSIAALRYEGDNYFSQYDTSYHMTRHPFKAELNGKDLSGLQDSQGVKIVVELVDAAKRGKGEFVEYLWPRGADKTPVPKLATAKLYAPWGLVIQSGIYIDDVETQYQQAAKMLGVGILAGMLVLMVSSWWMASSISQPLTRLAARMSEVAETGDLQHALPVESGAEMGDITMAFNSLMRRFGAILREVANSAQHLNRATEQLTHTIAQVEKSSEQQSSSAAATASTVEEITMSLGQITGNLNRLQGIADASQTLTQEGQQVVGNASEEMRRITQSVQETATAVTALGEDSRRISDIVAVIRDVADQTNLLALNAAIEAARAGESGRGFAVVADEVRKLAERTAQSTQQITEMISSIQEGTQQAVSRIQSVSERATRGLDLANSAGHSVEDIDRSVGEVSHVVRDIAHAAAEQHAAGDNIASHIEQISVQAQANATAIREVGHSAQLLEDMATRLSKEISHFKI